MEYGIKVWDGIPNEAFVEPFMIQTEKGKRAEWKWLQYGMLK